MNIYRQERIYNSRKLQECLEILEDEFTVIDQYSVGETISQSDYASLTNGVNFSNNKDVSYHQWLVYREGFSHRLVKTLIMNSTCQDHEIVLDPFCGSGTTNVVASQLGYPTVGIDVNPMSTLLTNAKLVSYREEDIRHVWTLFEELASSQQQPVLSEYSSMERYFVKENLEQLLRIKNFIRSLESSRAKILLEAAYISIILDCSDRKRDGNGLKKKATKVSNVLSCYKDKLKQITTDVLSNENCCSSNTYQCFTGSAVCISEILASEHLDTDIGVIIFSPPYPNSFDYFESYKLELALGGFTSDTKSIKDFRKQAIRSFIGGKADEGSIWIVDELANEIQQRIPEKEKLSGKIDSRTRKVPKMITGYFNDMFEVLRQCGNVLKAGKQVYIVVSQSAYLGVIIPTDLLFSVYAQEIGFKVKGIINCRKARTSTQQFNQYPYLKQGLRESIVVLEKEEGTR